jgi:hypothetical protein
MRACHELNVNGWTLNWMSGREIYLRNGNDFVARFKYLNPGTNCRAFAKFLVKNFTPAEYFAAYRAGIPPMSILEARGFVSPNRRAAERYNREVGASRAALAALAPNSAARHYATGRE